VGGGIGFGLGYFAVTTVSPLGGLIGRAPEWVDPWGQYDDDRRFGAQKAL